MSKTAMPEQEGATMVWLREIDAGTDNACWVACAKDDPGALEFEPKQPVYTLLPELEALRAPLPAHAKGRFGLRDEGENGVVLEGTTRITPFELLHALWAYGILAPVSSVIYAPGSHQSCLAEIKRYFTPQAAPLAQAKLRQEESENDQLIEWLMERMDSGGKNRESSYAIAPNSFGAGYDLGFYEALRETLALITTPPPIAKQEKS